jgi:hypothetical protein
MIFTAFCPFFLPLADRFVRQEKGGILAWPLVFTYVACAVVPNQVAFWPLSFLAGMLLAARAQLNRQRVLFVFRLFALLLQILGFFLMARFALVGKNLLSLGQLGLIGAFPFCLNRDERTINFFEIFPYVPCILLNPFVSMGLYPVLGLSFGIYVISAVNEQYVRKFFHRLFMANFLLFVALSSIFRAQTQIFTLLFLQLLLLYLVALIHLPGDELTTMTEVKGMAHGRPWSALALSLVVLLLSCGPLTVIFPYLSASILLLLFMKQVFVTTIIIALLCVLVAVTVRWILQLSLYSEVSCSLPEKHLPAAIHFAIHGAVAGIWIFSLQKIYRYLL